MRRVRELAARHKLNLVWPRLEYDSIRGVRNTSILIDRKGEVFDQHAVELEADGARLATKE